MKTIGSGCHRLCASAKSKVEISADHSIDGKHLGSRTVVYPLPGVHHIGIEWRYESTAGPAFGAVFLDLAAGHAYEARVAFQGRSKVKPWLEDKGKGFVVHESAFVK